MISEWLTPLLEWFGIGLIPFILLLIAIILIFKD